MSKVPSDLWRKVMKATANYEEQWALGMEPTPEIFASDSPDIPRDLLTPELERLRIELSKESLPNYSSINPGDSSSDAAVDLETNPITPLTDCTQGVGTPGYADPELTRMPSSQMQRSADIYSLGAVLHCILTGSRPTNDGSNPNRLSHKMEKATSSPQQTKDNFFTALHTALRLSLFTKSDSPERVATRSQLYRGIDALVQAGLAQEAREFRARIKEFEDLP